MNGASDWKGEDLIRSAPSQPERKPLVKPPETHGSRIAQRRRKVELMIKSGMTASEIGCRVNVPSSTIYKDAQFLGLKCVSAKKKDT